MNSLIIKYSSLGDVIQAIPMAKLIHDAAPDGRVSWLVDPRYRDLLEGNPFIDEVISFDKRRFIRSLSFLDFSYLWMLRKKKFERVYDAQGLFFSGLLARATGAKERIGFQNAREGAPYAYTKKISISEMDINAARRYSLLVSESYDAALTYDIPFYPKESAEMVSLLRAEACQIAKPVILLCPTSRWPTKNWPLEKYMHLALRLSECVGNRVIFIGAPEDRNEEAFIQEHCPCGIAWMGLKARSLRHVISLMRYASLIVTNDTGPMHLAAAMERPLVALFGPTSELRTGPWCEKKKIITANVDCRPCFERSCPIKTHVCMEKINVDDVFKACQSFLVSR